jgi:hypothetical protein
MDEKKAVYLLKNKKEKNEKPNEQDIVVKIVRYEDNKEMWDLQNYYKLSNKWNHPNIVKIK